MTHDSNETEQMPKPKFQHDCNHCKFLGHVTINEDYYDLYIHEDDTNPEHHTFIARRSDDGSDYTSTPLFALLTPIQHPALIVAFNLYLKTLNIQGHTHLNHEHIFYNRHNELVLRFKSAL